eukprot:COSAG04_NODE_10121_length_802_cov_1.623044_2_plen_110_part_00
MAMAWSPMLFLPREQQSAWAATVTATLTETVAATDFWLHPWPLRFLGAERRRSAAGGEVQWVIRVATEGPGPFAYTDADLSRTTLRLRSPGDNAAMSPTMRMPYVSIKS